MLLRYVNNYFRSLETIHDHNHSSPPRWLSGRRSSHSMRKTGFKPRVGQFSRSFHQLATDAIMHCVPWRKLRRWAPPTRYILFGTTSSILKI